MKKSALIMAAVLIGGITMQAEARNCNNQPKSCNWHHGAPNVLTRAYNAKDTRLVALAKVEPQGKRRTGVRQTGYPNSGYFQSLRGSVPNVGRYVVPVRVNFRAPKFRVRIEELAPNSHSRGAGGSFSPVGGG